MTAADRTIREASDLDTLDFDKADGLMPVVVQAESTGDVLMVAFANREALQASLETGQMHFWSRSRASLWRKGETSGNTLTVRRLHTDCDNDTVLAVVEPTGPACHTGDRSCFGAGSEAGSRSSVLERLDETLADRAATRPDGSYTVRLLDDANLRLKKLGEESAELVAALATADRERAIEEAADLIYHVAVGLRAEGLGLDQVLEALAERAG